jgi:ribosomal protein L37AE/L43A
MISGKPYNKYYEEGVTEHLHICPKCERLMSEMRRFWSCSHCGYKTKLTRQPPLTGKDIRTTARLKSAIEATIGRRISADELSEVADLIKYYLKER